ncbi:MAG: hypothetical protein N3B12_04850, partial [Armatimonadetes bacterium]|nr:hypothetical protein [Armatimonadota bacterium]
MYSTPVLLIFVVSILTFSLQNADAASCELIVDVATIRGPATFRASGFLHGISPSGPPKELVEPLKPKLFRAVVHDVGFLDRPGIYERATAMGAKIQVDLGSAYGCPAAGPCPGDDGDWSGWDLSLIHI